MRSLCNFAIPVLAFLISINLPPLPRVPTFKIPRIPGLTLKLKVPVLNFVLNLNLPPLPRVPTLILPTIAGLALKLIVPVLGFVLNIVLPPLPRLPIFTLPPCPLDKLRGSSANDNAGSNAA